MILYRISSQLAIVGTFHNRIYILMVYCLFFIAFFFFLNLNLFFSSSNYSNRVSYVKEILIRVAINKNNNKYTIAFIIIWNLLILMCRCVFSKLPSFVKVVKTYYIFPSNDWTRFFSSILFFGGSLSIIYYEYTTGSI